MNEMPVRGDVLFQWFDQVPPPGWTVIGRGVAYRICDGTEAPMKVTGKAFVVENLGGA